MTSTVQYYFSVLSRLFSFIIARLCYTENYKILHYGLQGEENRALGYILNI